MVGPHKIIELKGEANVKIQLRHNNRKTVVHANRLKPYFVAFSNTAFHPNNLPSLQLDAIQSTPNDVNPLLPADFITLQQIYCLTYRRLPILHLPLQLLNHRKQIFPLVNVLKLPRLLLPLHTIFYLMTRFLLCALACAHTPARLHTPLPPKCASSCHKSGFSRCPFCKGVGIGC